MIQAKNLISTNITTILAKIIEFQGKNLTKSGVLTRELDGFASDDGCQRWSQSRCGATVGSGGGEDADDCDGGEDVGDCDGGEGIEVHQIGDEFVMSVSMRRKQRRCDIEKTRVLPSFFSFFFFRCALKS